jgi:deoxyribonuclease-4
MATDKLGAHVSTAGGVALAPAREKAIEGTAMQIFTKQANQWKERVCEPEECTAFRAALADTDVVETCAHDSYLINLASPKPDLRERSLASFVAELKRCDALGLNYLVSHPGNYMDDRASGIARNAEAIGMGLEQAPGNVMLLMETTAGTGTAIGSTFEELADLLEQIPQAQRSRVGICMDTCHIFAAGYDLINDYDGVMQRFGDVLGFARLRMMHLNDSKHALGTHKDRHELIAEGHLGEGPFRRIMTDERLLGVAKVLETPKGDDDTNDRLMLQRLRSYTQ